MSERRAAAPAPAANPRKRARRRAPARRAPRAPRTGVALVDGLGREKERVLPGAGHGSRVGVGWTGGPRAAFARESVQKCIRRSTRRIRKNVLANERAQIYAFPYIASRFFRSRPAAAPSTVFFAAGPSKLRRCLTPRPLTGGRRHAGARTYAAEPALGPEWRPRRDRLPPPPLSYARAGCSCARWADAGRGSGARACRYASVHAGICICRCAARCRRRYFVLLGGDTRELRYYSDVVRWLGAVRDAATLTQTRAHTPPHTLIHTPRTPRPPRAASRNVWQHFCGRTWRDPVGTHIGNTNPERRPRCGSPRRRSLRAVLSDCVCVGRGVGGRIELDCRTFGASRYPGEFVEDAKGVSPHVTTVHLLAPTVKVCVRCVRCLCVCVYVCARACVCVCVFVWRAWLPPTCSRVHRIATIGSPHLLKRWRRRAAATVRQ